MFRVSIDSIGIKNGLQNHLCRVDFIVLLSLDFTLTMMT